MSTAIVAVGESRNETQMTKKPTHNHDRCFGEAMRNAEAVCAAKGLRLTKSRKRVLELIWQGHKALKAYDLIALYDGGRGTTKPPTVYRALDFLVSNGLAHRIESLNAYIGCPMPAHGHDSHFFICDCCLEVTELDAPGVDRTIEAEAKASRFRISKKNLEIHGTCEACAA